MAVKTGNRNNGMVRPVEVVEAPTTVVQTVEEPKLSLEKVEETRNQFSMESAKQKFELDIRKSGVIDSLTSTIDINNSVTILEFGKEPAAKMAQISDQVLSKYNSSSVTDTSKLVDSLLNIMKKIDIDEVKNLDELSFDRSKKKGLFARFKESAQEKLDRLVTKYKGIGAEIEQVCNQLTVYEQQIKDSNKDIAKMYEAAKEEYKDLVAVLMAAEQACDEIREYENELEAEFQQTGDNELQFTIQNVRQALTLMEQRTADLRGAESIALQSIPTFKIQEYTNSNLARKVNSAFIVTIPAFKSALVNSVIAKQQAIQAQGLSALDEATSQLIRKNADNVVAQLQMSQKLANSSAIKVDDIEYSWNTIMSGIQQYKEMEKQYLEIRKEEAKRIEVLNNQYLQGLTNGTTI